MSREWVFAAERMQRAQIVVKASSREEALEKGQQQMQQPRFWEIYGDEMRESSAAQRAQPWHKGVPRAEK